MSSLTKDDDTLWLTGLQIVQTIRNAGFHAYLVGGCVRDRLLGRPINDIDIATSARPEQVTALFAQTIPTGIRHGTVTVVDGGHFCEVTTYRTESGYTDGRRPDVVAYVDDIADDLARRDLTINAMAVGLSGEWIDPFGGRRDLSKRLIRCVGEPSQRFSEDALRMLRAIRFAAALDFRLLKSVWRGIRTQAHRLQQVAMERVGAELDSMMAGPDPDRACALLQRSGLLAWLKEPLPERMGDAWETSTARNRPAERNRLGKLIETDVRWMAWLSCAGASPTDAVAFCRLLRMNGSRVSRIAKGLDFEQRMSRVTGNDKALFVKTVLALGRLAARDWLAHCANSSPYRKWLDELAVDHLAQLAINGETLIQHLDKPPGPWVSRMLQWLLEEVALGRVANEREALIQSASASALD